MQKSQLQEFLKARIGRGKGKLIGSDVAKRGGITGSYISERKNGISPDPWGLSAGAIYRLAKGLGESPVVVFKAVIGQLKPGFQDESLEQILQDFSRLHAKDKEDLAFMIDQLKKMIRERLKDNP